MVVRRKDAHAPCHLRHLDSQATADAFLDGAAFATLPSRPPARLAVAAQIAHLVRPVRAVPSIDRSIERAIACCSGGHERAIPSIDRSRAAVRFGRKASIDRSRVRQRGASRDGRLPRVPRHTSPVTAVPHRRAATRAPDRRRPSHVEGRVLRVRADAASLAATLPTAFDVLLTPAEVGEEDWSRTAKELRRVEATHTQRLCHRQSSEAKTRNAHSRPGDSPWFSARLASRWARR